MLGNEALENILPTVVLLHKIEEENDKKSVGGRR